MSILDPGPLVMQEDGYSRPVAEINKVKPTIQQKQPIPSHLDAYVLHTLSGADSAFMLAVTVARDQAVFGCQQTFGPYMSTTGNGGCWTLGNGGYGRDNVGSLFAVGKGLLVCSAL